jgi:hypothetical protein
MKTCEIIYVKQSDGTGWQWRAIATDDKAKSSDQTFELFYECVTDARQNGYQPNQKCL